MVVRESAQFQSTIWKGTGGQGWVEAQALLDQIFEPFEGLLVQAAGAAAATRVLDVGCGSGATTVAVARRLGAGASCLGIDVSELMIDAARARAERDRVAASFVCADAQTHAFAPAEVDLVISRFGVMFFEDPIQAFANLHAAATPTAKLCCIVWRSPAENPFMTEAERAAEPFLPGISERVPDQPGQFGFADRQRVEDILAASGWGGIELEPLDVACAFPAAALEGYLARLGPVGRALQTADASTRQEILGAILPAFDRYLEGAEVRFNAACWVIRADRAGVSRGVGS